MIESFSDKRRKFIDETYYVNLGVLLIKKKFLIYLEKNNIFPSVPQRKKFFYYQS